LFDKNCSKIFLKSECVADSLINFTTIVESTNRKSSIIDPKLSINMEKFIYDGIKISQFIEILSVSYSKLEIFDLKIKIEERNLKKLEDDAEEIIKEQNAMNMNGGDETMSDNVSELIDNLNDEHNIATVEILKEKIKMVGYKMQSDQVKEDIVGGNCGWDIHGGE